MQLYIKSNLNSNLYDISVSSLNGRSKSELSEKLLYLLNQIPLNRYILVLGDKGYNTGYLKSHQSLYDWLYNGQIKEIDSYWDTSDTYIVLPEDFKVGYPIEYEDDNVTVWDISFTDKKIYSGIEDEEPMKDDDWEYCEDLGCYYLTRYHNNKHYIYIKAKMER